MAHNEERAERAREVAEEIGAMLYEKQMSYGDVGSLQSALWAVLLAQYDDGEGHYVIPKALMTDIPRLTRVFDRIGRIVSNPAGDRMGEDPWRDLAGDAIIGVIIPRNYDMPQDTPDNAIVRDISACPEPGCERSEGHPMPHRRVHAGRVEEWPVVSGIFMSNIESVMDGMDSYTHGFNPEDEV